MSNLQVEELEQKIMLDGALPKLTIVPPVGTYKVIDDLSDVDKQKAIATITEDYNALVSKRADLTSTATSVGLVVLTIAVSPFGTYAINKNLDQVKLIDQAMIELSEKYWYISGQLPK